MSFITVRSFDNYIDANIMLGKLQNEGITCFLRDEYTVTIDPILTNAVGGIKLTVPEADVPRAVHLLEMFDKEKRKQLECPQCHSHDVEYISNPQRSGNWLSAVIGFLFGNYAVSIKKVYHCFACGFEFDELPEASSPAFSSN